MARTENPKLDGVPRVRAECFLLCDFARAENAKLYIVGGGWEHIVPQELPLEYSAYLAIKLVLPGEMVVQPVTARIVLLDDGEKELGEPVFETRVQGTPTGEAAKIDGQMLPEAAVFMAIAVQMALAEPGRFILRLLVADDPVAETSFILSLALPG